MCQRPARRGRSEAQPPLQAQVVNLVNHPVDVITQRCALVFNLRIMAQQFGRPVAAGSQRIGLKPQRLKPTDRFGLRFCKGFGQFPPGICKKPQRPGPGDRGIELAQGSSGRIARVGERLIARLRLPGVQRGKIGVGHIHFAAHFQHVGRAGQLLRDVCDSAGIGGDLFAHLSITPRGSLHQFALLIAQRQRQAVNLGFRRVGQRGLRPEAQVLADACVKLLYILGIKCVAQRQHAHGMGDLGKPLRYRRTHLVGRAVAAFQRREPRLNGGVELF